MIKKNSDLIDLFVPKYLAKGPEEFYKFILYHALNGNSDQLTNNPAVELLDYYEIFLKLYRRNNEPVHFELAILFRKAAHKVQRVLLKKKLVQKNLKFLYLVE